MRKVTHYLSTIAMVIFSLGGSSASFCADENAWPSQDMPMSQRMSAISKYFKPAPGGMIAIDASEMRDLNPKKTLALRGFVSISPPKGFCLTLRKSLDFEDMKICKTTSVSFSVVDLKEDGSLVWQILGPGDIDPIDVKWSTTHRLGKRVPSRKKLPSLFEPFLMTSCRAEKDSRGPVIRIFLAGERDWTIVMPEKDELTDQDPELPEVYIQGSEGPSGGIQGSGKTRPARQRNNVPPKVRRKTGPGSDFLANKEEKAAAKEAKKQAKSGGAEKGANHSPPSGKSDVKTAAAEVKNKSPEEEGFNPIYEKRFQLFEDEEDWAIPRRGSFEMSAKGFKTLNDEGPTNGICRYTLSGAFRDSDSGWIECHDVGMYDVIFVHLPCAKDFQDLRRDYLKEKSKG